MFYFKFNKYYSNRTQTYFMKDNFIGNKLKEISEEYESWCRNIALDALCGKYDYIKSEDWWKEKIKQSLTDYHNHIVEKIDGMEKENIVDSINMNGDITTADMKIGFNQAISKVVALLQDTKPKEL